MVPPDENDSLSDQALNTENVMKIITPMIEKAYPTAPSMMGRLLSFGSSQKNERFKIVLQKEIKADLKSLIALLNSSKGQTFFDLLRKHIQDATPLQHNAIGGEQTSAEIKQQRQIELLDRVQGPLIEKLNNPSTALTASDLLLLLDLFTATGEVTGFFENTWTEVLATPDKPDGISIDSQNDWQSLDEFLKEANFATDDDQKEFARNILTQRFGFMLTNNVARRSPNNGIIDTMIKMIKNPEPEKLEPYFRHITGKGTKAPEPKSKPSL